MNDEYARIAKSVVSFALWLSTCIDLNLLPHQETILMEIVNLEKHIFQFRPVLITPNVSKSGN